MILNNLWGIRWRSVKYNNETYYIAKEVAQWNSNLQSYQSFCRTLGGSSEIELWLKGLTLSVTLSGYHWIYSPFLSLKLSVVKYSWSQSADQAGFVSGAAGSALSMTKALLAAATRRESKQADSPNLMQEQWRDTRSTIQSCVETFLPGFGK